MTPAETAIARVRETAIIKTSNGTEIFVDAEDYPVLSRWTWGTDKISHSIYAYTNIRSQKVTMHQLLTGPIGIKMVIDHIDGNGLNNTKENLRVCKASTNVQNRHNGRMGRSSRFRGVHKPTKRNGWRAMVGKDMRVHSIGTFLTEMEAAIAYDKHVLEIHGRNAFTNFRYLMNENEREIARPILSAIMELIG